MFMNIIFCLARTGFFDEKKTAWSAGYADHAVHAMDYVMTFRIGFVFLGFHLLLGHQRRHQSRRQIVGP